jgi:hypothetical protein
MKHTNFGFENRQASVFLSPLSNCPLRLRFATSYKHFSAQLISSTKILQDKLRNYENLFFLLLFITMKVTSETDSSSFPSPPPNMDFSTSTGDSPPILDPTRTPFGVAIGGGVGSAFLADSGTSSLFDSPCDSGITGGIVRER